MPNSKKKIAVILPNGQEYSSRLMTGVNYFRDEYPEFEPYEFRFTEERIDPLPADLSSYAGAIAWVDLGCVWVDRLLRQSVKLVNCCFDWQGVAGVVSLGLDRDMSCALVLAHAQSLSPRKFAVIGVNFSERPHAAMICQRMLQLGLQDGLDAVLYELNSPHPDELRSRMTEMDDEQPLLDFLASLSRPVVVWCENDFIARMVCNAAEHLNIAVPHQMAVIGCGDYRVAIQRSPTITTLPRPAEEIGYAAARLLDQWIDSNDQPPQDIFVPPRPIVMRQSSVNAANWDKIRMARELIQSEASMGLTVERVCRRFQLSKMTFTKRYNEMYGTTPGADIAQQKAEVAMRLLRDSKQTISEIATALGFSEQSKFSKFFKRQTGQTPASTAANLNELAMIAEIQLDRTNLYCILNHLRRLLVPFPSNSSPRSFAKEYREQSNGSGLFDVLFGEAYLPPASWTHS